MDIIILYSFGLEVLFCDVVLSLCGQVVSRGLLVTCCVSIMMC